QAREVFDEYVVRAALQRDVVIAGIDLAVENDDLLAADVDGVGVRRIARRHDADVFDRDIAAFARDQVETRRVGERDAFHVQPLDISQGNEHGPRHRRAARRIAASSLIRPDPEHGARTIDRAFAGDRNIGQLRTGDERGQSFAADAGVAAFNVLATFLGA